MNTEIKLNREEFIKYCEMCGYASRKNAIKYADDKGCDSFSDDDFINVFRINERENDVKNGALDYNHCDLSSDQLLDALSRNPMPWKWDYDLMRYERNEKKRLAQK